MRVPHNSDVRDVYERREAEHRVYGDFSEAERSVLARCVVKRFLRERRNRNLLERARARVLSTSLAGVSP